MKYSDIEDAFLFVSMSPPEEHYAYLNKETGETFYVSTMGDTMNCPTIWRKMRTISAFLIRMN